MTPDAPREPPARSEPEPPIDVPEETLSDTTLSPQSLPHRFRPSFVWIGIAFEAGLGMVALALGWCLGKSPLTQMHLGLLPALVSAAAALPMVAGLVLLLELDWKAIQDLRRFLDESVLPMFTAARWWELALLCTAAGLGEELLFRGLLQPIFCGALGLAIGLIVVNLVFGLMHPFSITYVVLAGVIGLYLSVLFLMTDNLLTPVVAHGLYDFVALTWWLWDKKQQLGDETGSATP
jgi:membrane protease YdiL (CAAX protease family)